MRVYLDIAQMKSETDIDMLQTGLVYAHEAA